MQYIIASMIGLVSGITSGVFGVGGGVVMVPAMVFFMTMDIRKAIGTSLLVIIPTAISGSFKHYQLGNIDLKVALSLAPAAVIGGYIGPWLTKDISSGNLKRMFGGLLVFVGLRMLLGRG